MQDTEIEVFRADTRASRGITAERLASVAAFDCDANPIGICLGHPKSNSPSFGSIAGFRLDGSSLFAKLRDVKDEVVNGIRDGSLLNRSMAFFHEDDEANPTPGKLAPRHLGLLGASAPGIPGMPPLKKALAFAADDTAGDTLIVEDAPAPAWVEEPAGTPVIFTAKETTVPDPITSTTGLTAEQLDQREAAATAREQAAAARIRTAFEASNGAALDAMVLSGKVLPAELDGLKLAFNALDPEAEELTFGAGDKATKATAVSHVLAFMAAALPKRVPIGDRLSPSTEFSAGDAPTTPLDFNAKAEKLAKDKGITFDEAAEQLDRASRA